MLLLFSPPLSPGFAGAFLEMGGLRSYLRRGMPDPAWGSKGEISSFQCYSYAAELKNETQKSPKKSFSARASCFTLFSGTFAHCHRDAHPSPGLP